MLTARNPFLRPRGVPSGRPEPPSDALAWALRACGGLLLAVAAFTGREALRTPRPNAEAVVHRMVQVQEATYSPSERAVLLRDGQATYALPERLWTGIARGGEPLAAALRSGPAPILFFAAPDTQKATIPVLGVEAPALQVPPERGLYTASTGWWTNLLLALGSALGGLYVLARSFRRPLGA